MGVCAQELVVGYFCLYFCFSWPWSGLEVTSGSGCFFLGLFILTSVEMQVKYKMVKNGEEESSAGRLGRVLRRCGAPLACAELGFTESYLLLSYPGSVSVTPYPYSC